MKKTLIAVIATALVLVSCHQPTKEEQQDKQVMVVFEGYAKDNIKVKWSVDSIVYDTAGNTAAYAAHALVCLDALSDLSVDLLTPTMLANFQKALSLSSEQDTTPNIVAVIYTTLNKESNVTYYCGIRHGIVHAPHYFGDEALEDINTEAEQAMYDASEEFVLSLRATRMILEGRGDFIGKEDVYNLFVNKHWRIDAKKLD